MSGAPIRLAVAGVGLIGRRHVDAIRRVEAVELAGIADPSEAGRAFSAEAGVRWFSGLDALLAQARPDGVIVATPTSLHVEQGLACVAARRPVLIEKPLAVSTDDATALVSAAQRAAIPILVGHHRRFNPIVQKAREVIEAGKIGDIRTVHANCWFYKPDSYFDDAPWRKRLGAGPISVNLVHDIDLMRHLCGEVASVQTQCTPSSRGFENEEVAGAVLAFENGAVGTVSVSDSVVSPWSWELTSRENPRYPPTSQSCYLIGGTRGSLSLPDLTLWTHEGQPDWWSPMVATTLVREDSDPLVNQIAHFSRVISGKDVPRVPGDEGLRTLRVIEAIQTAARTGETVRIDDLAPVADRLTFETVP